MFLLQAKKDDENNTEKSNDTSISEQLKVGPIVYLVEYCAVR